MIPERIEDMRAQLEELQRQLHLLEDLHTLVYGKPYEARETTMLFDAISFVENVVN